MKRIEPGRRENHRGGARIGLGVACAVYCAFAFSATTARATSVVGEGGLPYFTKGSAVKIEQAPAGAILTVKTREGVVVKTVKATTDGTASVKGLLPGYYELYDGSKNLEFVVSYPRKSIPGVVSLDAHLCDDWMWKPGGGRQGRVWDENSLDILNKNLIIAKHTGAYCLRERFRWNEFEPVQGKWDDTIYQRYYLPELKAGFKLLPAIEGLARWADAIPGKDLGPPNQEAWQKLFVTLSDKYSKQIPIWQVWNEPNPGGIAGQEYPGGSTPTTYVDAYAKGARAGVDASGKKLKLVLGGSGISDVVWNRDIIRAGAMKYIDAYDLHLYGSEPFTFEPLMKDILKELDKVGFTGPIMGTEFDELTGWGLPKPKTPQLFDPSADKTAQLYTLWFALDKRTRAGSLFKFDIRDYLEPDVRMGIAKLDYSPKPDLAAMSLIAHRLAGATLVKSVYLGGDPGVSLVFDAAGALVFQEVSTAPKISMQLIKDSDGKIFATVYGRGDPNIVTFRTDSDEISLLPATGGNPVKVQTIGGVVVLPLLSERFYYIDGIKTLEDCKQTVGAKAQ